MWRRRRRLRRLEAEIAAGRAERAELRRRLAQFESIAAAAGASAGADPAIQPWQGGRAPAAPLPATLLAAARDVRSQDVPVRLEVAGAEVVAVVGGPGDPREWWSAVWKFAGPQDPGPQEASA